MKGPPKSVASLVKKALPILKAASQPASSSSPAVPANPAGFEFSISTKIPKEWLASEESGFDHKLIGAESIKSSLNKKISAALAKASGLSYDAEGDIRIVFDFTGEKPAVSSEPVPVFVFGRYMKLVPGLSQSRWLCSDCGGKGCHKCAGKGKHYDSVEERIGEPMKAAFAAQEYTMHASGREDVDATNTAGRPFVMEIKNPKKRRTDLVPLANAIAAGKEVSVSGLRMVPRPFTELVTESHFDKEYEAEVEFEKDAGDAELKKILSLQGAVLDQQTPERVAHRRADLIRKRKVIILKLISGTDSRHASFRIKAEAGTYIKELISGDNGRTNPSFAGVLGFGARCTRLAVTKIDDSFLDTCLPAGEPQH